MKHFISKKVIKLPRYKIGIFIMFIFIIFIIGLNISINKYMNKDFINILINNSFGNYNKLNNKNIFYKNIYGFYKEKESEEVFNNIKEIVIDSEPLIYIYNTFQTDKYKSNYYNTYTTNPVVTRASLILQEYLKLNEINSIVETNSVAKVLKENNISYFTSYRGSRILLENAYRENNSIKYFFDIQLSSENYESNTVEINNKKHAKVLFIVGCLNTNYEKNKSFATTINDNLIKINDKVSKGISLRCGSGYHGVYNQDFNENVLMLEIGSKENTIDEVNRTLILLAQAIKESING